MGNQRRGRKGQQKNGKGKGKGHRGGGGRQNQPLKIQPDVNYFMHLNQFNIRHMLSFLHEDDRYVLGKAYPRFKINVEQKQQLKIQREKLERIQQEKKKEKEEKAKQQQQQQQQEKDDEKKSSEDNDKDDKLTEQQKKDQLGSANNDPNTLLARLNTKRLCKRLQFQKKQNANFDWKTSYPLNKTTEEIATFEWQKLLVDFRNAAAAAAKKKKEEEEKQKEGKEEETNENKDKDKDKDKDENENNNKSTPIPASCELLLFSPCPRAVAVLASYPRSGNSLLRTLYEKTTLRVTGSDMMGGLEKHDLVGEMATQTNSVQFVKTHFPERMGRHPFGVNRAVLLVRNPYDALESYFNLMMTNTHTTSLTDEQRAKHKQVFEEMVVKEVQVWRDFHEYWLAQDIPLLVIRYEDLIRYTDKVIAKVIRFVLEINDMRFFEGRIDRCIREEQIERLGSYKPRSGGIGKSLKRYSPELLYQLTTMGIENTMAKFGYDEMLYSHNPDNWKLRPMDQFGVYIPGKRQQQPTKQKQQQQQQNQPKLKPKGNRDSDEIKPLIINKGGLVRGPKRNTNWAKVKQ